jgi:hypothetical protein
MPHWNIQLNTTRSFLVGLPADQRLAAARPGAKLLALGRIAVLPLVPENIPDNLLDDDVVARYVEIDPPWAMPVLPDFQEIVNEIEVAYVTRNDFAALTAACVSIERLLNIARIELHRYLPPIKKLWNKKASNAWDENIDALHRWGNLDDAFAAELLALYRDVRNRYLHSGPLGDMRADALRSIRAAYRLIGLFLAFPTDLFGFNNGALACNNVNDPRYKAFFAPHLIPD